MQKDLIKTFFLDQYQATENGPKIFNNIKNFIRLTKIKNLMKISGYDVKSLEISLQISSEKVNIFRYLPLLTCGAIGHYKPKKVLTIDVIAEYLGSIYGGTRIYVNNNVVPFDGFSKKINLKDIIQYKNNYENLSNVLTNLEIPVHSGSYLNIKTNSFLSCFLKQISHQNLFQMQENTACNFLVNNLDFFEIPEVEKVKYSDIQKLIYILKYKKRYVAFQTFLYFSFTFSILSTIVDIEFKHFLYVLSFWFIGILGIGVDHFYYKFLGKLKTDECMGVFLKMRKILKKDLQGYCWLTVSNINGVPHIEYKPENMINSMDTVLGRYSLNYNPSSSDCFFETKKTYNNFGYSFWFFNRNNFKVGYSQKNYFCCTNLDDIEFELLNFHYWINSERKKIFNLAFENMTGLKLNNLSKHQQNKYDHLYSVYRISRGKTPYKQMSHRFKNIFPKLLEHISMIEANVIHAESATLEIPIIDVQVIETVKEIKTIKEVEREIPLTLKYKIEDIAISHNLNYDRRIECASKYFPANEPLRRLNQAAKEMIKLKTQFDEMKAGWTVEDPPIIYRKVKEEIVEVKEIVEKKKVRKVRLKKDTEDKKGEAEIELVTKIIHFVPFKRFTYPEPSKITVEKKRLSHSSYNRFDAVLSSTRGFFINSDRRIKIAKKEKRFDSKMREKRKNSEIHELNGYRKVLEENFPMANRNKLKIKDHIKYGLNELSLEHFFRINFRRYNLDKFKASLSNNRICRSSLTGSKVYKAVTDKYITRKDLLFKFIE
jgi:hypothetical protein